MAAARRVIEISIGEEDLAQLKSIARSRTAGKTHGYVAARDDLPVGRGTPRAAASLCRSSRRTWSVVPNVNQDPARAMEERLS
jgi:hypothetical protein